MSEVLATLDNWKVAKVIKDISNLKSATSGKLRLFLCSSIFQFFMFINSTFRGYISSWFLNRVSDAKLIGQNFENFLEDNNSSWKWQFGKYSCLDSCKVGMSFDTRKGVYSLCGYNGACFSSGGALGHLRATIKAICSLLTPSLCPVTAHGA